MKIHTKHTQLNTNSPHTATHTHGPANHPHRQENTQKKLESLSEEDLFKVSKMIEKPKNPTSNLAITGIYLLTPKIFSKIKKLTPSWRNEFEIVDALQMLLDDGGRISYDIITEFWKDTGTPNDIIHANRIILENIKHVMMGIIENDVEITGSLSLGKNSVIKSGCKIIGPVIIGDNCTIDHNSMIGSNVSICL